MATDEPRDTEETKEDLTEYEQIMPEDAPFEDGFGWKTIWATAFVGIVMLPGAIYLGLVTGQSMAGASEWVTIILFLEIAKRSFVRLRTQEILIIYWVAAGLLGIGVKLGTGAHLYGGPFGGLIWDQYLIQSPAAKGLDSYIPNWVTPPLDSPVYAERTFVHPDWILPVLILFVVMIINQTARLSFGYVMFRITSDIEQLPFPLEPVHARGVTALAETSAKAEGWRWRVFSTGTCIGLVWGLLYVVVPTLSGIFLTETVQVLPIPFIDFTAEVKTILPAAVFGIGTDLGHLLIGFVLPFYVVVGSFIGAVLANLVINPVLYLHTDVLSRWAPGMTAIPASISNRFDFWLSFGIGTSFVIAATGFYMVGKTLLEQRKIQKETGHHSVKISMEDLPEGRGDIPMKWPLVLWVMASFAAIGLCQWLVPEFQWYWLVFFAFIYTPVSSYIGARMIGLTGSPYGASIPYIREAAIFLSGYKGVAVWFAPIPLHDHGLAVRQFKQLELTKTKIGSYIKMVVITTFVIFICSFMFYEFIWRLGPIPSATYPYVQLFWPFEATMQTMWLKATLPPEEVQGAAGLELLTDIIKAEYIGVGFVTGGLLYLVLVAAKVPVLAFFGFVNGLAQWPHFVILNFAGAMLGRYHFEKRFGESKWKAYAPILLAGYSCGMGLIGMTSIAVALISKAVSQVVF
ncbi:MAG: peptide transporter [Gemmatimonadetes bacterium]|nr:peptide transporter [Gemmatimonadota bacterium]